MMTETPPRPRWRPSGPLICGWLLILVALFALLAVAPASAQAPSPGDPVSPDARSPADQALLAAEAALAAGDWQSALVTLAAEATDPRAAARLFDLGLALLTAAEDPRVPADVRETLLDGSIAAFRVLLVVNPEATRVRLELARAFFVRGQDGLARRQFRRVLAGDIPEPVAANVQRFLTAIEARRRWSAYGGFALAPDTNIGQASSQRTIALDVFGTGRPLNFTRDNPPPTSGVGLRLFGGGEYHHPINDRTRLRLGAGIAHTDYKTRAWDSTTLRFHLGPEMALTPRTRASLLLTTARRWDAGETSYDDPGLRLEMQHRLTPRTRLTLDLARRERRHVPRGSRALNGPRTDLTLGVSHQATPTLAVTGSLSTGREKPDRMSARTRTRGLRLGLTRDLARGWTVGVSGTLSRTRWDSRRTTADRSRRQDTTTDVTVSILKRDLTVAGFSPRLSVGTTRRRSNNTPDDQGYKRTYADISFVRQF